MKKKIVLVFSLCMSMVLAGCNRQMFDTTYNYTDAIIKFPNGEIIEGKIKSWMDYEDGDQIQVNVDGTTYLVHSANVTLISK